MDPTIPTTTEDKARTNHKHTREEAQVIYIGEEALTVLCRLQDLGSRKSIPSGLKARTGPKQGQPQAGEVPLSRLRL